jgi:hypothetical protein
MAGFRLPQSVAVRRVLKAYLASDHVSAATGKTIAVTISKNGAAFGNPSAGATSATEISAGWYYVDLSTADTGTKGPLVIRGTAAATDDVEIVHQVVDAHNADFDALPAAAANANGGLPILSSSGTTLAYTVTTVTTTTTATNLANLPAAPTDWISAASVSAAAVTKVQSGLSTLSAAGVWDLATSGHTTSGTFGAAMNAAGAAGDPWSTAIPGAYGAGTAGFIVGTNLNATVGSRATQTSVDTVATYIDTEIAQIKVVTDKLGVSITAGGLVSINYDQTGVTVRNLSSVADAALTTGDLLVGALAGGLVGDRIVVGTALTVKTPGTGTTVAVKTLDSASAPTSST